MSDGIWFGMFWGFVGSAAIVLCTLTVVFVFRSLARGGEPRLTTSLSVAAPDPANLAVLVALLALVVGFSVTRRR